VITLSDKGSKEKDMDDKEPEHRPLIGRLAGLAAIAFFIPALVPGDSSKFFSNLSSQQIVDWAAHNGRAISFQAFGQAFGATVFALFIVLLVVHVGARGIPTTLAYISAGAMMAVNWTGASMQFALADAAQRAGSDSGVVALFSLVKTMALSDGYFVAIPAVAVSLLALRSQALPAPICWLGLVVGGYHFVEIPIQLALTGTATGVTGPIGVVIGLLWLLVIGVTLVIKPVWGPHPPSVAARAAA
jgi:hypothetical protein